MQLLYTIETSPNPQGNIYFFYFSIILTTLTPFFFFIAICALSPSSDNCYLAYPSPAPQSSSPFAFPPHVPAANNLTSPNRTGDVVVFDTLTLQPVNVIEAHKSPLAALSFNADGNLLATASDKGTIVRVFSIPSATKLYQFRRGTYPSRIFSINFNAASSLLAVSSATETVHIFRLARPGNVQPVSVPAVARPEHKNAPSAASPTSPTSPSISSVHSEQNHQTQDTQHSENNDSNSHENNHSDSHGSPPQEEHHHHEDQQTAGSLQADSDSASSMSIDSQAAAAAAILPQLTNREESVNSLGLDSATDSRKWHLGGRSSPSPGAATPNSTGNGQAATSSMASMLRRGSRTLGRQVAGAVGTYLPSAVTEMWEPQRDFAFVKLPGAAGLKSVVAFNAASTRLFAVTSEGYFYQYAIDHAKGGEGQLLQQYSLLDNSEE